MTKDTKFTIAAVGVLAVAYLYLRKKKGDLLAADSESSFSNASGCSMSDLSDLMSTCEGGAMEGETASILSCKIKRNGTRVGKCRYDSDGGVRYTDVTVGGGVRMNRDVASSFSNGSGAARKFCKDWKLGGFSSRQDCMTYVSK